MVCCCRSDFRYRKLLHSANELEMYWLLLYGHSFRDVPQTSTQHIWKVYAIASPVVLRSGEVSASFEKRSEISRSYVLPRGSRGSATKASLKTSSSGWDAGNILSSDGCVLHLRRALARLECAVANAKQSGLVLSQYHLWLGVDNSRVPPQRPALFGTVRSTQQSLHKRCWNSVLYSTKYFSFSANNISSSSTKSCFGLSVLIR